MTKDGNEFWPDGIRLVVSISMQFEAGGQPLKGTDSPFPAVDFPNVSHLTLLPTRNRAWSTVVEIIRTAEGRPFRPASCSARPRASIYGAAGGDRPDLLDAVAADPDIPVIEVDGRVAVAGISRILSPSPSRWVAAETVSLPCSSEARS
jgi:hypothetical protein